MPVFSPKMALHSFLLTVLEGFFKDSEWIIPTLSSHTVSSYFTIWASFVVLRSTLVSALSLPLN